jgi:hypothetical protein
VSLDVYLVGPERRVTCRCSECDDEHIRISRPYLYSANITHNLNSMAEAAGIYKHLWRPEEIGVSKASELLEPLRVGIALLKSDRAGFEQFNAPNGWGLYEHFVPFVERYLEACELHPDAEVRVSR